MLVRKIMEKPQLQDVYSWLTKRHELLHQIIYLYRCADERCKRKLLKNAGDNRVVFMEEGKKQGR